MILVQDAKTKKDDDDAKCGTIVPQQVDLFVRIGCGGTSRWVVGRYHALGVSNEK